VSVVVCEVSGCNKVYKKMQIGLMDVQLHTENVLGAGNFGVVMMGRFAAPARHPGWQYLRQLESGDRACVAVKTIRAQEESTVSQFLLEMRLLAVMTSGHVVKLLAVQEWEMPLLMVMEYCEGGDLKSCLMKGENHLRMLGMNCGLVECYHDMSLQIARAVEYLHSKLCIHRDLAARNVLVRKCSASSSQFTQCGLLMKLSDLGLARAVRTEADYYRVSKNEIFSI